MINTKFLQYIPIQEHERMYNILLEDIYYFYYGVRVESSKIKVIDCNKWNLSKNNLCLLI